MRRLLAPRLLPWHLLILTVAVAFVALGLWQLDRHRDLQARNDLLERRLAADPAPYRELVPRLDPDAPEGAADDPRFRPVILEGTFVPEDEVLLRGRTLDGRPGYHVVTPLRLAGSRASDARGVLIDRGWIPFRDARPNDPLHAPREGTVLVLGWLMPEADAPVGPLASFAPRDPPEGELSAAARIDVDRLQDQVTLSLDPFYVLAAGIEAMGTDGETDTLLPRIPPPPAPEAGPHIGYAFQWFFFALVTLVGYAALLRRRLFAASPGGDDEPAGAAARGGHQSPSERVDR